MRILFIGDVFGKPGRAVLRKWLPGFRESERVDFVIANTENAAGGKGVNRKVLTELFSAGIDVMTGGNHSFAQRGSEPLFQEEERLLRPANLPPGTPGRGCGFYTTEGAERVAVVSLMGRAFMKPIECPFRAGKEIVEEARRETPVVFVDFHAEATSEKVAMAAWLDGAASAVVGTHTHIPTADARVSEAGTAAITDVGMTGPFDSVIGVRTDIVVHQFVTGMQVRHEVADRDVRICGVLVDIDSATGRALSIRQILEPGFPRGASAAS